MHDIEPLLDPTFIREMIRPEINVTNHRIVWLLIVQATVAKAEVDVCPGSWGDCCGTLDRGYAGDSVGSRHSLQERPAKRESTRTLVNKSLPLITIPEQ